MSSPVKAIFIKYYSFLNLDIFKIIPVPKSEVKRDVPPWETKGRGTPVKGNNPTIEAILSSACTVYKVTIPTITKDPYKSG